MQAFWESIPAPIRSAIRVAFGALLTWALTDGVQLLADTTIPPWVKGLILAVIVPSLRALDPTETAFGKGSTPDPVGAHEAD